MNHWSESARCVDLPVAIFFDDVGSTHGLVSPAARHARWRAKQICARCPVIAECLNHAVTLGIPFGVYGGMDQKERAAWFVGKRKFTDSQKQSVLARLQHDQIPAATIMRMLNLTYERYTQLTNRKWPSQAPAAIDYREYTAWADVYAGEPALTIHERHQIPYERALDMIKVVDAQPTYRGPKGHKRNAYWATAV